MGKSLSVLALVLRTLGDAHSWSSKIGLSMKRSAETQKLIHHSPGTLIVASSDRKVLYPWVFHRRTDFA